MNYIFNVYECTITFENSTTDNTTYTSNSPIFKNTFISFENDCPYLILSTFNNSSPKNDEIKEGKNKESNDYVQNHIRFFFLLMTIK